MTQMMRLNELKYDLKIFLRRLENNSPGNQILSENLSQTHKSPRLRAFSCAATLSIMTLSITTLSIMGAFVNFSKMAPSKTTLSMMMLSITTLSIMGAFATLSIILLSITTLSIVTHL